MEVSGCYTRCTLDFRYIAIEGPLGVGKTALADQLGARFDATVVLDEPDASLDAEGEFAQGQRPFRGKASGAEPIEVFGRRVFRAIDDA